MKRPGFGVLAACLVLIALTAVGCCDKEKQELATLQADYNDLTTQNKDLRTQLAQSKTREAELLAQVDAKDMQLSGRDQELTDLKSGAKTGAPAGWEVGAHADRVTVGSDILFASGKASLTSQGKATLDKIAADIKATYAGMPVRVCGFTDSDPIKRTKNLWQDNLDLSANRAMAVTRYLWDKGIAAETIETVAMGSTRFVTRNILEGC